MTFKSMNQHQKRTRISFLKFIHLPVTVRFSKTSQMKKYPSAKTDELNHDALKARGIVHCNNLYFSNSKM